MSQTSPVLHERVSAVIDRACSTPFVTVCVSRQGTVARPYHGSIPCPGAYFRLWVTRGSRATTR